MSYNIIVNTNTRDREEAEHHVVHFLQLPARRKEGLGGLLPPQGVGVQVGEEDVRTPPPVVALSAKHYSSSGAPVWNCERSVDVHHVTLM